MSAQPGEPVGQWLRLGDEVAVGSRAMRSLANSSARPSRSSRAAAVDASTDRNLMAIRSSALNRNGSEVGAQVSKKAEGCHLWERA